jgi:hypothetical protein
MIRTAPLLLGLLGLAACNGPDPNPLAWSATYARPYEALTSCLAQRTPVEYQVVPAIDQRQNLGGVLLTSKSNGQKAGEFDVYRIDDGNSRVVFRSAIRPWAAAPTSRTRPARSPTAAACDVGVYGLPPR